MLRPWRWLLLIYAVALTIATHWPRLQLSPEIPASDKTIHMLAFGLLTVLLWRSGLIGPRWLVALVALCWAGIDEISQGIPALQRTVSWHDMIANACGVLCAAALLWAMRPPQEAEQLAGPNQARARLFEFTFDEMFAHRRPWNIGIATGLACAIIIAVGRQWLPSPRAMAVFDLILVIVAAHVLYLIYRRIFFGRLEEVRQKQPCLRCGTSQPAQGDEHECPLCGGERQVAAFAMPARPSIGAIARVSLVPALVAFLGIAGMFAMVLLVPYLYGLAISSPGGSGRHIAPRLAQALGRLPPEVSSIVDLTVYILLLAVVVRLWRRAMASFIDRAVRCQRCGHDLHGTPVNQHGEGHCGECGTTFTREMTHRGTETQKAN